MKMTLILVFGMIGLVIFVFGAYEYFKQRRLMANAHRVQATIIESNISISNDLSTDSNAGPSTFPYSPVVKFSYELAGKQYESTLLRPLVTGRVYSSARASLST